MMSREQFSDPSLFDGLKGPPTTPDPPQAHHTSTLDLCLFQMAALQAEIAALRLSVARLRAQGPELKPPPEPES